MLFSIVDETKALVKKETEISAQVLRNLQSIYDQKIHLEMGHSGIFTFCVEELKMCPATAQRRCDALRISQFVPDLALKVEKGEIALSRVSQVAKFMRQEQKEAGRVFGGEEVRRLVEDVQAKSDYESQKHLMTQSHLPQVPIADQRKVVSGGRTVLQFEVDEEFQELLEQVKQLESHKGARKLGEFFKDLLKEQLKRKHPAYKGKKKTALQPNIDTAILSVKVASHQGHSRPRYVPAQLKKAIWVRDKHCTYTHPSTQKRCGSTFRLQLEHLKPFSQGGAHSLENLTLRCQAHNLYTAQKMGLLS